MEKNNRLWTLAESIKGYHTVLDIGTDHGLVLKYALDKKYISNGIASDIALKPLEQAKKNLSSHVVSYVLSDGFKNIHETFDAVVIAGMGGHTIIDILQHAPAHHFDLILLPHDRLESVRKYLSMHNYYIVSEKIIFDKHYYSVFHIIKRTMILSEKEMYTGKHILMDNVACTYFSLQQKKYEILALKATDDKALLFHQIAGYYEEVHHECIAKSSTI